MAVAAVIGDDHIRDRALMPFCQMFAIHGLTIIAHRCSILITTGSQGNAKPAPKSLHDGTGLPRGKPTKSRNPGGRIGRMERNGALYRRPLRTIARAAVSTVVSLGMIVLHHDDYGHAGRRGQP
jgi:hypothetical protein